MISSPPTDSRVLLQPNSDYADPIGQSHADYQGHWIAAFAPVGNTGFFVIVQERYEDVLRVDPFGPWNLAAGAVLIACLGFAVFFLFLRRRRLRGFVIGRG